MFGRDITLFCYLNFAEGDRSSVSIAMAKSTFKLEHTLGMIFFFVFAPVFLMCLCIVYVVFLITHVSVVDFVGKKYQKMILEMSLLDFVVKKKGFGIIGFSSS